MFELIVVLISLCTLVTSRSSQLTTEYFNSATRINFYNSSKNVDQEFTDSGPLIFSSRITLNFEDALVTSISNIEVRSTRTDANRVEYQTSLNEFRFENGPHPTMEVFSHLILYDRRINMNNGSSLYEAGTVSLDGSARTIAFEREFDSIPVIIPQLTQSQDPLVIQITSVSRTGFIAFLRREAQDNRNIPLRTVEWIAFAQGRHDGFEARRIVSNQVGEISARWGIDNGNFVFTHLQTNQRQNFNGPLFSQTVRTNFAQKQANVSLIGASNSFRRGHTRLNPEIIGFVVLNETFERLSGSQDASDQLVLGESGHYWTNSASRQDSRTIFLSNDLGENPVIVSDRVTANTRDDFRVGLTNIRRDSFELSLLEWEYLNGPHPTNEMMVFLAVRRGEFLIGGDNMFQSNSVEDILLFDITSVQFNQEFDSPPVIIATVIETSSPLAVRIVSVTSAGFTFFLQTEEALLNVRNTNTFSVNWVAFEQGSQEFWEASTRLIDSNPSTVSWVVQDGAFLLTDLQSTIDPDPAYSEIVSFDFIRCQASVQTEEEQSQDSERNHAAEVVAYVAFTDVSSWDVIEGLDENDDDVLNDSTSSSNDNGLVIALAVVGATLAFGGLCIAPAVLLFRRRRRAKAIKAEQNDTVEFNSSNQNFNGTEISKFRNHLMNQVA